MMNIGRRKHLLDGLELPLVPDSDDRTPYDCFVFLCGAREAVLQGTPTLPQDAPFQPQLDKPIALGQRLTERALSCRLSGAELITSVHGPVLLWVY
jgi:hypothetical protein